MEISFGHCPSIAPPKHKNERFLSFSEKRENPVAIENTGFFSGARVVAGFGFTGREQAFQTIKQP